MKRGARKDMVMVRLHPIERQRAERLAAEAEIYLPELFRRLLDEKWLQVMPVGGEPSNDAA